MPWFLFKCFLFLMGGFRCPICFEDYNLKGDARLLGNCGHDMCGCCLKELLAHTKSVPKCPQCRKRLIEDTDTLRAIRFGDQRVQDLIYHERFPKSFTLSSIPIPAYSSTESTAGTTGAESDTECAGHCRSQMCGASQSTPRRLGEQEGSEHQATPGVSPTASDCHRITGRGLICGGSPDCDEALLCICSRHGHSPGMPAAVGPCDACYPLQDTAGYENRSEVVARGAWDAHARALARKRRPPDEHYVMVSLEAISTRRLWNEISKRIWSAIPRLHAEQRVQAIALSQGLPLLFVTIWFLRRFLG